MSDTASAPRRGSLSTLFGIVFLDLLGFGILIPQLGVYAYKFDATALEAGLLLSVYSVMQLVAAPLLGRMSDRIGRRPILMFSLFGSLVGYVLFAFAGSLTVLFASRIVDGLSGGNISIAQAYAADITTGEHRAKGMGVIGAAFGLGFIFGPVLGGFLGAWGGNLAIGLFAAGLSLVTLILTAVFLPETRVVQGSAVRTLRGLGEKLRLPVVGLCLAMAFLFTTGFAQMEGTFSMYLLVRFLARQYLALDAAAEDPAIHDGSLKAGYVFLVVGIVSAIIQGGLIGRLRKRYGEPVLILFGASLTAVGMALVVGARTYAQLFVPFVVIAAGAGLFNPALSSYVSLNAPEGRQGEVLGTYQAMGSLGRVVGPALGGFLFTRYAPGLPFPSAAVMALIVAGCSVMLFRPAPVSAS